MDKQKIRQDLNYANEERKRNREYNKNRKSPIEKDNLVASKVVLNYNTQDEIDKNHNFDLNMKPHKDIIKEACERLSYNQMCHNCCAVCERDIQKYLTNCYKITDELINVSIYFNL